MAEAMQSKAEQERNRRINFFVMRFMWQTIKGRAKESKLGRKGNVSIYDAFGINRERYTRAINKGSIRYKNDVLDYTNAKEPTHTPELDSLTKITGLRKDIFTGVVQFECASEPITSEEWEELFHYREQREITSSPDTLKQHKGKTPPYKEACDKYKAVEKIVTDKLAKAVDADPSGTDFDRLCYYLKHSTPAPIQFADSRIEAASKVLFAITFDMLDVCGGQQLNAFCEQLKKSLKLANTIKDYKLEQSKVK